MSRCYENRLRLIALLQEKTVPITRHSFISLDTGLEFKFDAYRGDLLGKNLSGNKVMKLTPNLAAYIKEDQSDIPVATFGGSHSNHLRAFGVLARMLRLNAIAFLRESPKGHHKMLEEFLIKRGVKVILLSPEDYKQREDPNFISTLNNSQGRFHLIPEGGTTSESVSYIAKQFSALKGEYSHVFVPVGLGGTLSGIAAGVGNQTKVIGVSAVKSDPSLTERVQSTLQIANVRTPDNWTIDYKFHFGGFGKTNTSLDEFTTAFEAQTNIELYRTYTAKSAYAMAEYFRLEKIDSALWINTYNPA